MPKANITAKLAVKSYEDAARAFLGHHDTDHLPVCGNTVLVRKLDCFALKFHQTEIVRYYPGYTVLNSGGYRTATTKHRMNQFSRFRVSQDKGKWFVYSPLGETFEWENPTLFVEGIVMSATRHIYIEGKEITVSEETAGQLVLDGEWYLCTSAHNLDTHYPGETVRVYHKEIKISLRGSL